MKDKAQICGANLSSWPRWLPSLEPRREKWGVGVQCKWA